MEDKLTTLFFDPTENDLTLRIKGWALNIQGFLKDENDLRIKHLTPEIKIKIIKFLVDSLQ